MPNLYFTGAAEFTIAGNAQQVKALKKAIKDNEFGLALSYELGDIPCIFYIYPFHVVRGMFNVRTNENTYQVLFDGVAKVPLDKSAVDYLSKKDAVLNIQGLTCHPYSVHIDGVHGKVIQSPFKISKAAPKS